METIFWSSLIWFMSFGVNLSAQKPLGGGNSNIFYFHSYLGKDFQFDEHIFQMGWFNHQLDEVRFEFFFVGGWKKHSLPNGTW